MVLGECDQDVFERGRVALVAHTIRSVDFEPWVVAVREASRQRVDWHLFAGRLVVKFIGDEDRVCEALRAAMPRLREIYAAECAKYGMPPRAVMAESPLLGQVPAFEPSRSPAPDAHPSEVPAVVEARPGSLAASDDERKPEGGPAGDEVG